MANEENWEQSFVEVNGIRLHYLSAGSGPLVLLLHGFPEFSYSWRHQIPALAKNFHVVAPDMRGYNKTDKPPRIEDYSATNLIGDVAGLIHELSPEDKKAILPSSSGERMTHSSVNSLRKIPKSLSMRRFVSNSSKTVATGYSGKPPMRLTG